MRPEITPDLLAYTKKFLSMHQLAWKVPKNPIRNYGVVTTIVLHREGQFQTELVIAHPNSMPWKGEHCHPLVDSIEVEVSNCKGLTRNGEPVIAPDVVFGGRYLVHLAPTDLHGSKDNSKGISLLSHQKWTIGTEPTSVGENWSGCPVSDEHENILTEGSVAT